MEDCCKNIYNKYVVCNNVLSTAISTNGNKFNWKKERQYRITGSRCHSIFTYSKDDWQNKSIKYFWFKDFSSKYTNHGIEFEPEARECYIKKPKLTYKTVD